MRTVKNGVQGWTGVLALMLATGLVACGGGAPEADSEPMAEEPMAEEPTAAASADTMEDRSSTTPSVSFVTPADGATVSSPVAMEFIVSNLNISPVPSEVESPREGMGHHHVAIDTECLPVGAEIPKADPWVHFGDGSKIYETLLPAGQHTLTLQIGDDEHRTQEGLCTTISITVE
ncbi:MAG: DUF4399 domain-containing protein [Acidobacteria bacterium]|nr:MAG: DUF4399 domain-containing protein [Acidobacteriota bacterium]